MHLIVGVDEAGRGPLAGPVAVGVVAVPSDFDWGLIPGVGDSKKIPAKNREAIFGCAQQLRREQHLACSVSMVGAEVIDRIGISRAVALGIARALRRVAPEPTRVHILLDGLLRAPKEYLSQETIIKGDAKEPVIGLASILAKVTRDRYMVRTAKQFAPYGFEQHKGYGTQAHRAAIKAHGLTSIHRRSFCKKLKT